MTTATAPSTATRHASRAYAPTAGYVISQEQLGWLPEDWEDHFDGSGYALSVIRAASRLSGLLRMADLRRLLADHGHTVAELEMDLEQARRCGHSTRDTQHAGQALTWLGY